MNGILFKPEMIKAIIEDRKTQTRRVIKPCSMATVVGRDSKGQLSNSVPRKQPDWVFTEAKPRYHVGEVVYIKEGWDSDCTCGNPNCNGVIYKLGYAGKIIPNKWRSPLFLKEIFARYFIQILAVDACRTRDITPEDCVKEGISTTLREHDAVIDLRNKYFALYDFINGKGAHLKNWDFRYLFKRVGSNG